MSLAKVLMTLLAEKAKHFSTCSFACCPFKQGWREESAYPHGLIDVGFGGSHRLSSGGGDSP